MYIVHPVIECFHSIIRMYFRSSVTAEPFLNGTSSVYVEQMYDNWKHDPNSVHKVKKFYVI